MTVCAVELLNFRGRRVIHGAALRNGAYVDAARIVIEPAYAVAGAVFFDPRQRREKERPTEIQFGSL